MAAGRLLAAAGLAGVAFAGLTSPTVAAAATPMRATVRIADGLGTRTLSSERGSRGNGDRPVGARGRHRPAGSYCSSAKTPRTPSFWSNKPSSRKGASTMPTRPAQSDAARDDAP